MTIDDGTTALMTASCVGAVDTVRFLMNYEAKMKQKEGWTALHFACKNGFLAAVEALFEAEGEIDLPDGTSPLMIAAERGHLEICTFLTCQSGRHASDLTDN